MESNIKEIIEEFMESALAQWIQLFENMVESEDGVPLYSQYMEVNSVSKSARERYLRLTNGVFLNEVMRFIDPNPKVERLFDSERDDHMLRVQNFSILNRHLRAFYQEDLQQLILMPLPNVAILGQDPLTEAAVEELRRLLLLLLGCAVQCEKKETFIQQIQSLDIETQAAIAGCIQQVTQDPRMVLPLQWEELVEDEGADLQLVFSSMAKQIQSLLAHRDTHLERIAELCRERETQADSNMVSLGGHSEEPPQGLALQLADSKAKLRRLKQQLEDKGDQILDYKQEIEAMEEQLRKLQKENRSLQGEVRGMRALRDELDCARERAARSEQLQTELQSCKHRLRSLELTRTQLKNSGQLGSGTPAIINPPYKRASPFTLRQIVKFDYTSPTQLPYLSFLLYFPDSGSPLHSPATVSQSPFLLQPLALHLTRTHLFPTWFPWPGFLPLSAAYPPSAWTKRAAGPQSRRPPTVHPSLVSPSVPSP